MTVLKGHIKQAEVSVMCNLSKGIEEKGVAKGHAEKALSDLCNLMETLGA